MSGEDVENVGGAVTEDIPTMVGTGGRLHAVSTRSFGRSPLNARSSTLLGIAARQRRPQAELRAAAAAAVGQRARGMMIWR